MKIAFFTSQSSYWEVPDVGGSHDIYFGEAIDLAGVYRELKSSPGQFELVVLKGHKRNITNDIFIRKISREFHVQVIVQGR